MPFDMYPLGTDPMPDENAPSPEPLPADRDAALKEIAERLHRIEKMFFLCLDRGHPPVAEDWPRARGG
jgi:hypothetical protein